MIDLPCWRRAHQNDVRRFHAGLLLCAQDDRQTGMASPHVSRVHQRAQVRCDVGLTVHRQTLRGTVVGDEDEAHGGNVQPANGEQPRRQGAARMLAPPLRQGVRRASGS